MAALDMEPDGAAGRGRADRCTATSPDEAAVDAQLWPRSRPGSARSTCWSTTPGSPGPRPPPECHETPVAEWDRVLAVNVRGPFLCSRAVLPSMVARGSGHIITIASVAGLVAFPGRCAYTASKGAALMLTRSIAVDYAAAGIRANAVCPGMVYTPMTSWRLDQPDLRAEVEDRIPAGRVAEPGRDRGRGRAAGLRPARLHDRPPAGRGRRHVRAVSAAAARQMVSFGKRRCCDDRQAGRQGRRGDGGGVRDRPGRGGAVRPRRAPRSRWWTSTPTRPRRRRSRSPRRAAARSPSRRTWPTGLQVERLLSTRSSTPTAGGRAVQQRGREQQRVGASTPARTTGTGASRSTPRARSCAPRPPRRSMVAAGGGSIINQGSVAALVGIANFASYCASKGAVVALTRSMSVDLAPRGVRVNVICPGTVYTPLMEPMLRARGGGDMAAGLALTVAKYPIGRLGTPGGDRRGGVVPGQRRLLVPDRVGAHRGRRHDLAVTRCIRVAGPVLGDRIRRRFAPGPR